MTSAEVFLETFPGRQSGTDWTRAGSSVTRRMDIPLVSQTLDGESTDSPFPLTSTENLFGSPLLVGGILVGENLVHF